MRTQTPHFPPTIWVAGKELSLTRVYNEDDTPDWDSIVNGYESLNFEYDDIKETIEYIYGDNVPVDLPEPCTKHGYNHPDNCYECDEEKEDDEE